MGGKKIPKCHLCEVRKTNNDVFLARFPVEVDRCRQWVKSTGDQELMKLSVQKLHNLKYICGEHFAKNAFTKHKKRLKRNAIPTINISTCPIPEKIIKLFPIINPTTKDGDLDEDREHSPDNIEDDDSQSSPNGADVPKPVAIKIIETIIKLKITDKSIKTFCNDLREYSSHQMEERARIIDRFYSWLTDSQIRHCERIMGAYILKECQEILPEAANHPFLMRRVLTPKKSAPSEGIFDDIFFAQHIKPLIVELYKSREMKVRLHLLDSLQNYIYLFTEEEVKIILLPEILIGMQDSDKIIVRATLISLAQLVDVLGPTAVIGGQRQDIFTQTEVANREAVEKMAELDDPQSIKEENDSANESEADQDPLNIQKRKRNKKRKKDILDISTQREEEKITELDEPQRLLNEHNDDSANESEAEQDPLDIQERNKKRKKDVWDIFTQSEVAYGETIEKMTESDEPLSHTWEEIEDSANESEAEQDPLDMNERSKKRKTNVLGLTAAITGQRQIIYKKQNS